VTKDPVAGHRTGVPAPLGVLDLVPVTSGAGPETAVARAQDLARATEAQGYSRYWFAEHHLNPGVAGTSPALMIALVASATSSIRLGSGGVQSGHRTALSVVEEFGLLDAAHPGRIDLGIGRSGGRDYLRDRLARLSSDGPGRSGAGRPAKPEAHRTANGLLIPARPSLRGLAGSPRLQLTTELLQQAGAETPGYGDLVGDILALLAGTYRSAEGVDARPVPGAGAAVEVWVLGSSAGESAQVAGRHGLRFAANYHVSPATVLEATEAYRAAFVPSAGLDRPYVAVSADVVVGPDDEAARELATGFGLWVLSVRRGQGAIPFPSPAEARRHRWSEEDRALVKDRVDTQFVGSPETVVAQLEQLRQATEADEVLVTTITHDHRDRVRSYGLLAERWFAGAGSPVAPARPAEVPR
jgi:alkanesulfonate monooxygenase SsuD/methylene tetrahydromethanopterin reductase-like flavin-dependent oxidoreductase (luciferase family)